MKTVLVLTFLMSSSLAFAQACPADYCPPIPAENTVSEIAVIALNNVIKSVFLNAKTVSYNKTLTTHFASQKDNLAAIIARSNLRYEHVDVNIELSSGITVECPRAIVITEKNNNVITATDVQLNGCEIN